MSDVANKKPKLLTIYAPGFGQWLKVTAKNNLLVTTLIVVFILCVGLFALSDAVINQSSVQYRVTTEVVTAILIAATVGLFYELVARSGMTTETVRVVKRELDPVLEALRESDHDCGLVGFGATHDYFHHDIEQHLPTFKHINVMAIHGTRVWDNANIRMAILQRQDVNLEALLLDPDSRFVQARVEEYPEMYDLDVTKGQISAHIKMLQTWRTKNPNVEIRQYDYPPSFWLVIVDDVLYVSVYGKGQFSQEAAVYKFDNRPNSLYHFFREHFGHVWASATEM